MLFLLNTLGYYTELLLSPIPVEDWHTVEKKRHAVKECIRGVHSWN